MIVQLEETKDGSGDLMLPLGDKLCTEMGWNIGDTIKWTENGDGSFTLSKSETETELVLVETVSMFRMRYLVEVPKGKKDWALDSVTLGEVEEELGQRHIDETIVSNRVITCDEALALALEDNEYATEDTISRCVHTSD